MKSILLANKIVLPYAQLFERYFYHNSSKHKGDKMASFHDVDYFGNKYCLFETKSKLL